MVTISVDHGTYSVLETTLCVYRGLDRGRLQEDEAEAKSEKLLPKAGDIARAG